MSPININHEVGPHARRGRPTATLATPVVDDQGGVLGLVVINLGLGATFELLSADLPFGRNQGGWCEVLPVCKAQFASS